ncbi:MAG: hypothetical protein H6510_08475 [Acidobacteria bacterium]|nr:hypothetical protein [Acidobacteriota bacterium]MCB9397836.1 hypothetical protein [Acidobacteriota bacterium]
MAVLSFLAFAKPGRLNDLMRELEPFSNCVATASTTHDVAIVLAETDSDQAIPDLNAALEHLDALQGLALVSGFSESAYGGGEV